MPSQTEIRSDVTARIIQALEVGPSPLAASLEDWLRPARSAHQCRQQEAVFRAEPYAS